MYGGNDKFSIISKMLIAVKNNKELTIANNGNAVRDFIHVQDVANIYSKLIDVKNINFLNIGTGLSKSIKHIILTFKKYNADLIANNISLDEINTSTANVEILNKLIKKQSFIEIENFIKQESS